MAEDKAEKKLIEEENPPEVFPEEGDESEFEEEDSGLSYKQIISLSILGFIGLFLFVTLLFPIEEILRYLITKNTQNSNFTVDFKKMNFPIFGTKTIDSLYIITKDNVEIKSEEIQFTVDIPELYKGNIISHLEFFSSAIDTESVTISARTMSLDLNLLQSERENTPMNGSILLSIGGGKLVKLPPFPVLDDLSNTSIKSISLIIKKNGNRLSIEKGTFDLSIGKISIKGRIDLSPLIRNSRMDLELCPKLSKEFSTERQDLADTLTLLAKDGKEVCIPMTGTFSDPKINLNISSPGIENPPNSTPEVPKFPQ